MSAAVVARGFATAFALVAAGCARSAPGQYAATGPERDAVSRAHAWNGPELRGSGGNLSPPGSLVAVSGEVEVREVGPGGQALVRLRVAGLCSDMICERSNDAASCRVMVVPRAQAPLWVLVSLAQDDEIGPHAVKLRSLLRVVGRMGEDLGPADGGPILHATFYRHFPTQTYREATRPCRTL